MVCKLTMLIVSFNGKSLLDTCLSSVFAGDRLPDETIVIDNGSTDGTLEMLASAYPFVRVVSNDSNLGHTRAVNQGIRESRGDFILLLDADTEVSPNAVRLLHDFMLANPDAWLLSPRTLNSDGTIQESARRFPSPINALFGRQSFLSRLFPENPFTAHYLGRENLSSSEPFPVESISSAAMLFRKDTVRIAGEWDEAFAGYWVDTDWCKRVGNCGGGIWCVPGAVVVHHEQNRRGRRKSPRRIILFHQGVFRFYRKHYTWGWSDPRTAAAVVFLTIRTIGLLMLNSFLKKEGEVDPLQRR